MLLHKGISRTKKEEAIKEGKAFRYDNSWALCCKDINPKPVIRLRGANSSISFCDEIKGICTFDKFEIDSFVIIKEDGIPTYNFACSVDDMIYDIGYIIRGEDHVSNTPKQILIRQALGYPKEIKYAHLPIILNKSGKKMSKRDNESSVDWLLSKGFLPQAIINYLLSMGNKPKEEIFSLKDALEWFDIKALSKSPVKFDIDQLRHINREHLKRLNLADMAGLLESSDISIGALARIYLEESSTLNELRDKIALIFSKKEIEDDEARLIRDTIIALVNEDSKSLEDFSAFKAELTKRTNLVGKALFKPLRYLLTGAPSGPLLNDIYPYLRFYLREILRS